FFPAEAQEAMVPAHGSCLQAQIAIRPPANQDFLLMNGNLTRFTVRRARLDEFWRHGCRSGRGGRVFETHRWLGDRWVSKTRPTLRIDHGLTTVPSRRRTLPQRISKGGSSLMGNFLAAFSSKSMPKPGRSLAK